MNQYAGWLSTKRRELLAFAGLLLAFIAVRLPGFWLPFHQDEWKIAEVVRSQIVGGVMSAHPPLYELIFRWSGYLVDADYVRIVPLTFGLISAVLLYLVVRRRAGVRAAYAAIALYTVCAYGVYASVMVDVDGAILPAFFLAAVYAYDRFRSAESSRASFAWGFGIAVAVFLGFLVKLSFVLVLGALILDYVIEVRHRLTRALIIRSLTVAAMCALAAFVIVASMQLLFSIFNFGEIMAHALSYVRFEGRGYLQILVQGTKAMFYLSPLLLVPLLFASKESLAKNRIFAVYLGLGALFYFVIFDFSQAALDKYLMFIVVPLAAIVGTVIADSMRDISSRQVVSGVLFGGIGALVLLAVNFLSPSVMPLYPKTAWLSAILSGNWNILLPFTGGNGPLGFYLSFLFITAGFILSAVFAVYGKYIPRARTAALVAVITVGVAYNCIWVNELFFGRINGSAPAVLQSALSYVARDEVKRVITHADAGSYELSGMGKRAGRFYAVPGYEEAHRELFAAFDGHYLVVDMPHINEGSFYSKFFSTCETVFATSSGVIPAHVYYCPDSDPYAIP